MTDVENHIFLSEIFAVTSNLLHLCSMSKSIFTHTAPGSWEQCHRFNKVDLKAATQEGEMNFLKTPTGKCHRKVLQFDSWVYTWVHSLPGSILKFLNFSFSKKKNVSPSNTRKVPKFFKRRWRDLNCTITTLSPCCPLDRRLLFTLSFLSKYTFSPTYLNFLPFLLWSSFMELKAVFICVFVCCLVPHSKIFKFHIVSGYLVNFLRKAKIIWCINIFAPLFPMVCFTTKNESSVLYSPAYTQELPKNVNEVKVPQLSPTLCDPMDCSLTGSSVRGVLQAGILKWVAIPFSKQIKSVQSITCQMHRQKVTDPFKLQFT